MQISAGSQNSGTGSAKDGASKQRMTVSGILSVRHIFTIEEKHLNLHYLFKAAIPFLIFGIYLLFTEFVESATIC